MFRMGTITRLRVERFWRDVRGLLLSILFVGIAVLFVFIVYPKITMEGSGSGRFSSPSALDSATYQEIVQSISKGQYGDAVERLSQVLKTNPGLKGLKDLNSQLMDELNVDFKFNYLPGRRRQIMTRQTSPGVVLTQKDPYYLIVNSSEPCYLYLFQLQSSGELAQLFPNKKYAPTVNPVPGGPIRVPDGYDWFYLDDVPGTETIYLLASRWQQSEIETLSARFELEKDSEQKAVTTKDILSRLQREEGAADKLPGLAFAKHQFRHEVSSK
jgi:hypothetical protein